MEDLYKYEKELYKKNIKIIGGVDEVGRGPLVGPVVACCCVLPENFILEGLTDSKKLSEKKRDEYNIYIKEHALAYAYGVVSSEVIDEVNIYEASKLAMIDAIRQVQKKVKLEHVLIDAMPLSLDIESTSIIKGDSKSISIAAASVLAKVYRDDMLYELDKKYPNYGFALHKGYPTKKHLEAIEKYGLIEGYRKTYKPVKKILERIWFMQVKIIKVGYLQTNCYILIQNGQCIVVDPGDDFFAIEPQIGTNKVIGVLITHRHPDHIGALDLLLKKYNVPVYEKNNLEEKRYSVEGFNFEVLFTPGHTPDSVCYYFYEYNFMFDGDFIFKSTIGRVDLEGGNASLMNESLKKILEYNKRMRLYPGHGDHTTLSDEIENNYYIKQVM